MQVQFHSILVLFLSICWLFQGTPPILQDLRLVQGASPLSDISPIKSTIEALILIPPLRLFCINDHWFCYTRN